MVDRAGLGQVLDGSRAHVDDQRRGDGGEALVAARRWWHCLLEHGRNRGDDLAGKPHRNLPIPTQPNDVTREKSLGCRSER
jgi:hypothetical protein